MFRREEELGWRSTLRCYVAMVRRGAWLRAGLVSAVVAALCVSLPAAAKREARQQGVLDEGRLEKAWFGEDVPFVELDDDEYFWVKPGFELAGRRVHFAPWMAPREVFLGEDGPDRDAEDHQLAARMSEQLHNVFAEIWELHFPQTEFSTTEGDVVATGQIVDCSTGNVAGKIWVGMYGVGAGTTVFNLKFVDKASGELLLALHHEVESSSTWSSTDSKLGNWVNRFAKRAAKRGSFAKLYQSGDEADD